MEELNGRHCKPVKCDFIKSSKLHTCHYILVCVSLLIYSMYTTPIRLDSFIEKGLQLPALWFTKVLANCGLSPLAVCQIVSCVIISGQSCDVTE